MKLYPEYNDIKKKPPLQSFLFGHRIQPGQTKYEYLIEFLQVAISRKENMQTKKAYKDMFPVDENKLNGNITYYPVSRIGLKRFVFLPKSKLDGKANVDKEAYNECVKVLKNKVMTSNETEQENVIQIIQNLLNGFTAVNQSRAWFDQNLLPICNEAILPEGMGVKRKRQGLKFGVGEADIDNEFDYNRYTYMARGGEVYYLHLLHAFNENQLHKMEIETLLNNLINSFPQFSYLCEFVQTSWEKYMNVYGEKKRDICKDLTFIPEVFSVRDTYTISELFNLLNSKVHPYKKMETLSNGIIIQLLRMMYLAAATEHESNCWVVDVNCAGFNNPEMKKIAITSFKHNEEVICDYLYRGLDEWQDELCENDIAKIIKDAAEDSYKLFRKLGKMIGIVIPNTGKGMRFTLINYPTKRDDNIG